MKTEWMDKKGQYLGLQVFALILQPFGTAVTFEYLSLMFDFFYTETTHAAILHLYRILMDFLMINWLFDTWK